MQSGTLSRMMIELGLNKTKLDKGLDQATKKVSTFGRAIGGLKNVFKNALGFAGGAGLAGLFSKATGAIRGLISGQMDFQAQMRNVNSLAKLSEGDFAKLNKAVLVMAEDPRIKDGPAVLAAGLYQIVSSGFKAADAVGILKEASIAASAGMSTTDVAATALVAVLNAYHLGADKAGYVSNVLFKIVDQGVISFDQLAGTIGTILPTANALGVGLEDLGAAYTVLTRQGVSADEATTQVDAVMRAFLKPTEAMADAIHAYGYENGQALIQAKGLGGALAFANDIMGGSADKANALFGDVRAVRGILGLTTNGAKDYADALGVMNTAQDGVGATQMALNEQMKSGQFQMAVLRKNLQILWMLGFGGLEDKISSVLAGINHFFLRIYFLNNKGLSPLQATIEAVRQAMEGAFGAGATTAIFTPLKGLVKLIGFLADHMDILGPALIGAAAGWAVFTAAEAIAAAVTAVMAISLGTLMTPVLAVVALGALLFLAWHKNLFGFRDITKKAVRATITFLQPLIDFVTKLGKFLHDVATGDVTRFGEALQQFPGWSRPAILVLARMVKVVRVFFKVWKDKGFLAALNSLHYQIRAIGRALGAFLTQLTGSRAIGNMLRDIFYDVAALLSHVVNLADDLIHGRWKKAWADFLKIGFDVLSIFMRSTQLIAALLVAGFQAIPWGQIGSALFNGLVSAGAFMQEKGYPAMWDAFKFVLKALGDVIAWVYDNTIKDPLDSLMGSIIDGVMWYATGFYDAGRTLLSWLWTGISSLSTWIVNQVRDQIGKIVQPYIDAYNSLWNAGHYLMQGLYDGILWAWNNTVAPLLDKISGWIPKWKGPPERDKKMLEPAGKLVMGGFMRGIWHEVPKLHKMLGTINTSVGSVGAFAGGPGSVNAGGVTNVSNGGARSVEVVVHNYGGNGDEVVRKIIRALRAEDAGRAP